jgi:hypothetical protein
VYKDLPAELSAWNPEPQRVQDLELKKNRTATLVLYTQLIPLALDLCDLALNFGRRPLRTGLSAASQLNKTEPTLTKRRPSTYETTTQDMTTW